MPAASPSEIINKQITPIPEKVFQVVNELLASHKGKTKDITIYLEDVMRGLKKYYSENEIYANHYLDFEPAYRSQNWDVDYHKKIGDWNPYWIFSNTEKEER